MQGKANAIRKQPSAAPTDQQASRKGQRHKQTAKCGPKQTNKPARKAQHHKSTTKAPQGKKPKAVRQ
jgi:hypothetical protein